MPCVYLLVPVARSWRILIFIDVVPEKVGEWSGDRVRLEERKINRDSLRMLARAPAVKKNVLFPHRTRNARPVTPVYIVYLSLGVTPSEMETNWAVAPSCIRPQPAQKVSNESGRGYILSPFCSSHVLVYRLLSTCSARKTPGVLLILARSRNASSSRRPSWFFFFSFLYFISSFSAVLFFFFFLRWTARVYCLLGAGSLHILWNSFFTARTGKHFLRAFLRLRK